MTTGHDLRLLGAACIGWAVTAAFLAAGVTPGVLGISAVTAVALAVLLRGRRTSRLRTGRRAFCALAAAVSGLVLVTATDHERVASDGPLTALSREHATAIVLVQTTGEPRVLTPGRDGQRRYLIPVRVAQVEARGRRTSVHTPAVLLAGVGWERVAWRSQVSVRVRLAPATGPGPARAVLMARGGPSVVKEPPALVRGADVMRGRFRAAMTQLPQDARGLVPALVVGDISAIPGDLTDDMNATGMSHLNAVSGSNVTIVLTATLALAARAGCGRRTRLGIGLVVLVAYVVLCRPDPSVIRAAAMGAVGVLGTSMGRPRAACPALGAAIVVLLVVDPWLSLSVGFALSALATLGLLLFTRPWTAALVTRLPAWTARPVEMGIIPAAAQVLCLPLLVVLNGGFCWVSVPANVLAEPLVAPATLAGMVVLFVAAVDTGAGSVAAWCAGIPAQLIAVIAHLAAAVPGGTLPFVGGPLGAALTTVFVGLLFVGWRVVRWGGMRGAGATCAVLAVPAACLLPLPGHDRAPDGWRYVQCDVGQGDAALVRTGPTSALAVDVGPPESAGMLRCLRRHGVRRLDAVFLTHYHADHVGALRDVVTAVRTDAVVVNPVTEGAQESGRGEQGAGPQVARDLERAGLAPLVAPVGGRLTFDAVVVDVLWPRRTIREGSVQNNASLVLDVTTPEAHVLLLGDCEKEAESALVEEVRSRAGARPYDIVKVAHHGSSNQQPRLYAAAAARYGVIGVGRENEYGHPARKLLAMLTAAGTSPLRTDEDGDVTFVNVGHGVAPEPER